MGIPIIGDIIDAVGDIVSEVIVDKDKKNEILLKIEELKAQGEQRAHEQILAQIEVNKVEAASGSLFVAGWRPFVGWVCGVGLAAQVFLFPLADRIFGWSLQFDTELLILTLGGMLGIGGMRTFEKVRGVSTNDFRDIPKAPVPAAEKAEAAPVAPAPSTPKPRGRFKI